MIVLPLGQHRHRRIVAVHALGGEDMPADQFGERAQHSRGAADMIGQRGDVELDTLAGVSFALSIKRLMLTVLGVKDHRQQAGPDMAARNDMEWRRRLGAVSAGGLECVNSGTPGDDRE
jgi:hypothetical protein